MRPNELELFFQHSSHILQGLPKVFSLMKIGPGNKFSKFLDRTPFSEWSKIAIFAILGMSEDSFSAEMHFLGAHILCSDFVQKDPSKMDGTSLTAGIGKLGQRR